MDLELKCQYSGETCRYYSIIQLFCIISLDVTVSMIGKIQNFLLDGISGKWNYFDSKHNSVVLQQISMERLSSKEFVI